MLEARLAGRRCGAAQPGQSRARSARQRRLLPVRGRAGARRAAAFGPRAGGLAQRPFAAREAAHPQLCARKSGASCAAARRTRAGSPGVMRHGYKGAAEIAATVDYLFAFAATARAVDDAHFDALYDAYLADDAVRGFMAEHNPAALAEIKPRFRRSDRSRLVAPTPQQRPRGSECRGAGRERFARNRGGDQPPPQRKDGAAQGGARPHAGDQDRGARALDRPYRQGQGQIDRRLRHGVALSRPRHAGRHRPVRQRRVGHRRAGRARALWRSRDLPGDGRGLYLGHPGPRPRHRRRARGLGTGARR